MAIAIPGFSAANKAPKPRLIINAEGLDKSGKTNFGFTAPGPVMYQNFDIGEEGVIEKFQREKVILTPDTPYSTRFSNGNQKVEAAAEYMRFHKDYQTGLKRCRTVIHDTGSEVWEVLRLARLGKLTQVMPHHYVAVNQEYRDLVRNAYENAANLIILSKLKPEWVNGADGKGNKTGRFERAGFSELGYLVQINMRFWRLAIDERDEGDLGFRAQVLNCRQTPELAGLILENDLITFSFIAGLVFPDVDPSAWAVAA